MVTMMTTEIASVICGGPGPRFPAPALHLKLDNTANLRSPCQCYQDIYLNALSLPGRIPDILVYIHDDVEIFDPEWQQKITGLFESNPECVVVGLGGATELGREGLYKRPYRISDMARGNYASNQRDWVTHGTNLSDSDGLRVAVVDAYFMAVRTSFLRGCGGWPVDRLSHHCLDLWICCEAARQGKQVWACGIDCHHAGGLTSTKQAYAEAKWLRGGGLKGDHEEPHKWLHDTYKDVLPIRIGL